MQSQHHRAVSKLVLGASLLALAACANESAPRAEGAPLAEGSAALTLRAPLRTASALRVAQSGTTALGDQPGELAYQRLVEMTDKARAAAEPLAVYEIEEPADPIEHLKRRADVLGVPFTGGDLITRPGDGEKPEGATAVGDFVRIVSTYSDRPWALQYNAASGAERFFDLEAFHVGFGDITKLDRDAYVRAAQEFMDKTQIAPGATLHLYKVRYYKNAFDDEKTAAVESTYQVAVAFNTEIDGVPVIGSGGKIAVHLGDGARPVSYESSHVRVRGKLQSVPLSELLPTEKAEALAWRKLEAEGLSASTHRLSSKQFGYLRRGRAGIQKLVAPSYAYFFLPTGEFGKKRVEVISAVTEPTLVAALDKDAALESARKRREGKPDDGRSIR